MIYVRSFNRFILISLALLGLSISAVKAATLDVSGGQLLGAFDVDVSGTLYDVTFEDGTCIGLFDNCDSLQDFVFPSISLSQSASAALIAQVFRDGPGGLFDTDPELTAGCASGVRCFVLTPYGFDGVFFLTAYVTNLSGSGGSTVRLSPFRDSNDTTNASQHVYAVWSPSAVPVPAAVWLFGTALIGLVGFGQRKSKIAA